MARQKEVFKLGLKRVGAAQGPPRTTAHFCFRVLGTWGRFSISSEMGYTIILSNSDARIQKCVAQRHSIVSTIATQLPLFN